VDGHYSMRQWAVQIIRAPQWRLFGPMLNSGENTIKG